MNTDTDNIEILSPKNQLSLFGYKDYFNTFVIRKKLTTNRVICIKEIYTVFSFQFLINSQPYLNANLKDLVNTTFVDNHFPVILYLILSY